MGLKHNAKLLVRMMQVGTITVTTLGLIRSLRRKKEE
jgi:hypothetical protein